ncbi:putative O-methyltransferase YrrM [Aneurinibacillus soli]|uniref:Putative O-methyltransferase/MSMEI_4947 n=1 Tax=Aneurinibacillus soli TaxID=1500254 RepID=A0A0U5AZ50_9BACL|nr:O-methyltransferase [Aneurinibacillus soli]PYE62917.1 putative O-methyltransferase YrrM [Aneurinibacillus soli]BAU29025.1 putative O-methyltransferase/MSMEI_4947 [Aneurinibacillus soli]
MQKNIEILLNELESFGIHNDANTNDSALRMKNITKDTGEFLSILIKSSKATNILEVGTSNGYSTIWLAQNFLDAKGHVTTIEFDDNKATMAVDNFRKAGLESTITLHKGDAVEFIKEQADGAFDFIFLDSDRKQYINWWGDLNRILKDKSLLVVDNVNSHREEVTEFINVIRNSDAHDSLIVSVGKGQLMIFKK